MTLSTWVVEVRWRPPPIHEKRPRRRASTSPRSSVVSRTPHSERGRTTTASHPSVRSPLAWSRCRRPACAPASSTARSDRSHRASARTFQPSAASLRIRWPPMNPDPPVTNAVRSAIDRSVYGSCVSSIWTVTTPTKTSQNGTGRDTRIASQRRALPDGPGVYLFRDQKRRVLYVGKAKSLRKRVASHFSSPSPQGAHGMLDELEHIEFIATHTEAEALLAEQNFIRQYRPRYNVRLRDDKSYP